MRRAGAIARRVVLAAVILCGPWPAGYAALEAVAPYGIGANVVFKDGAAEIGDLLPGGAADRDGRLKAGDRINAVAEGDGAFVNCAGMALDKVVLMIRGAKGTTVRLDLLAVDGTEKIVAIVRDEIKLNGQPAKPAPSPSKEMALPPDLEADLEDLAKKVTQTKRNILTAKMKKVTEDVAQTTGLNDDGKKALEGAAAQAVDECLKTSDSDLENLVGTQYKSVPQAQLRMLFAQLKSQADAQSEGYATWSLNRERKWPADQTAWKDGLKKSLTAAQLAAWNSAEAARIKEVEAQIGDYLNTVSNAYSDQEKRALDAKVSEVELDLGPSMAMQDKLNALAQSVIADFVAKNRSLNEKSLLSMDDDERHKAMTNREWVLMGGGPLRFTAWDDGLAKLLTPDEMKRLQAARDDRKDRRARALGGLLVALLDEKIAFTDAQRQQLEPIAGRLVKNEPALLSVENDFYNYSLSTFYSAASTASADEIKAILDPVQIQHWQEVSQLEDLPDNANQNETPALQPPDDPNKPHPPPEPEDVERAISDFLDEKYTAQQEKIVGANILKAEDIARVTHLPADAVERLQTAARGEAEGALASWKTNIEAMVRSNLGDVSPETVKQRLVSIGEYQFQNNMMQRQSPSYWDQTLKSVLNPDQENAWKKETDARSAYRAKAIAVMVVSAFDQQTGLSPDQCTKLVPMVAKIADNYSAEFGNFFGGQSAWFLQPFTVFLPIAGIPEKDMKAILTKAQWDAWTGNGQYAQASNYWHMIDQNHQQRIRVIP